MLYPAFLFLAAFVVSLVGTRLLIIRLRDSAVFTDIPNERSSHKKPTPKGGGIVVVTTIFMYFATTDSSNYLLLLMLILLAGISLINDIMSIHPLMRLISHFLAVSVMLLFSDFHIMPEDMPPWLAHCLLAVGWVWFINLFNFMDGIDGITASETSFICGGIAFILAFSGLFTDGLAYHAMIVVSAICGFWWWNRHPAKIFLGDVGSVPLGFLVGYLLLSFADAGFVVAAMILPAYYIMDATVTLLRRLIEGKPVMHAHREHFYQQAAGQAGYHTIVVQLISGLNLLLVALAHFSVVHPELYWLYVILAYAIAGLWCLVFREMGKHLERIRRHHS